MFVKITLISFVIYFSFYSIKKYTNIRHQCWKNILFFRQREILLKKKNFRAVFRRRDFVYVFHRDIWYQKNIGFKDLLTCGILNSRRRLATWIDVTELAAPTTPLITFRTVLLQWYSAPSMLLIEPVTYNNMIRPSFSL